MPSVDIKNQKRIMKKEYIKPEMVVEELLTVEMLAASTEFGGDVNENTPPPGANDRRGEWGNLWD